jgi:hypothetical protein
MHPKLVYIAAVVVLVGGASKRVKPRSHSPTRFNS